MKTNSCPHLAAVAFGLAALSSAGYADHEKIASAPVRPTLAVVTIVVSDAPRQSATAIPAAVTAGPEVAPGSWSDIQEYTFDRRVQLLAGLKQLEARVDDQIRELVAKRATMKGLTDTKEWDFAMKEMQDARSGLLSAGVELSQATQETWDQAKDKVGQAWVRTQDAYAKVKASTTT